MARCANFFGIGVSGIDKLLLGVVRLVQRDQRRLTICGIVHRLGKAGESGWSLAYFR